jgi:hypothetical protein
MLDARQLDALAAVLAQRLTRAVKQAALARLIQPSPA